jgi:hypothetical protein
MIKQFNYILKLWNLLKKEKENIYRGNLNSLEENYL